MTAPVRLEMLEALRLLGPCAIADIATMLDRPADALYRHMDKLVRLGVVRELEQRKVGRRLERVHDMVADHMHPGFRDGGSKAANQAYVHTVKVICKIAGRVSRDAAQGGQLKFGAEARNLLALAHHGWLTPTEFARVRELLMEVQDLLDAGRRRPDARLYLIASMLLPVVRKRGARRARVGGATSSAGDASTAPQLKILQEAITLLVFVGFSIVVLKEKPRANDYLAFALIFAGVVVSMLGRTPGATAPA